MCVCVCSCECDDPSLIWIKCYALVVLVTVADIDFLMLMLGVFCKNEVGITVAGIPELHGNDTIDHIATNWTKSTRIPDDDELFFMSVRVLACVCV